jgi:hypothetical protein
MAGSRLELVDGQQRFTTISLLLCALYKRLSLARDEDDDIHVELVNLKNRLFLKGTNRWRFEPSEQGQNKIDYQKVLSELFPRLVSEPLGLRNFGNRRIARAYSYFSERVDALGLDEARALLEKLKSAVLVKIEVSSHADAFVLFETINNRGIPLSAIDIIKNNLLAALEKKAGYGIDRAFEEWKDLIERLSEPSVQDRFLRQLYNVFKYLRRVEVRGCPRATRSNLIRIYDELIRRRPVLLFRQLKLRGKIYSALIDPQLAEQEWGQETAKALENMLHLGAAPGYAFLLWSSHVARARRWDEADLLRRLAELLTKWFFWRNLTDTPPTRELDQLFVDTITELVGRLRRKEFSDASGFIAAARAALFEHAPSEEICDKRLAGDVYVDNYDVTRFLLCRLEQEHQTYENQVDLWAADANRRPVFTVEHILPKTENLSPAWVSMLEAGTEEGGEVIRQRCAHKIGNLTLSGYNPALGKMDFLRKRDRKNSAGDFIGYRNGLYLNRELADREEWNENAINDRTAALVREVKAVLGLWGGA